MINWSNAKNKGFDSRLNIKLNAIVSDSASAYAAAW